MMDAANDYWVYEYDDLGQVKSGKKYWANGTPVAGQQYEFTYDTIGNVLTTATGGDATGANLRSAGYTNNSLNQLTSRGVPGYVDILGSATNSATVTVNNQATYRHGDYFRAELTADNSAAALWFGVTNVAVLNNGTNADIVVSTTGNVFVAQSPEAFAYDPDGNVTNDGRWTFTWDAENRLISSVSVTNSPTDSKRRLTFGYDYYGRRITKAVESWTGSAWTMTASNKFVYDGWNLLAELNATNNAVIRSYVWGSDLRGTLQGAGGVGGLLAVTDSLNGTHFFGYDGNGNVAALVKASDGTISAKYEYAPFGEAVRATGLMASDNPFRFSTKYQDNESDLIYYGYRYYSASTGRWLGRDPLEEQGGANLYAILGNDGGNFVDPLGLILFDKSSSFLLVYIGRNLDPRATWENVMSGDSLRVASAYSYHVLKAPVDLVEGIYHLPDFIRSIPELAELVRSGKLKCLLGAKWEQFLRASPEEQMEILGGLTGTVAGGWATGAEGANLIKALRAARAAKALEAAKKPLLLPPPKVKVPWRGDVQHYKTGSATPIEHIKLRHWHDSIATVSESNLLPTSRFTKTIGLRQLKGMVDEAASYGTKSGNSITHDFGRVIGTDPLGNPVTRLQVFLRNDGTVSTAYPF